MESSNGESPTYEVDMKKVKTFDEYMMIMNELGFTFTLRANHPSFEKLEDYLVLTTSNEN